MNLIRKIRSRLSETYRIRMGYGLNAIRHPREAKALYDFCMFEISYRPFRERELNPERFQIYKEYCKLYRWTMGVRKQPDIWRNGKHYINMYDYARDFAGWFWS